MIRQTQGRASTALARWFGGSALAHVAALAVLAGWAAQGGPRPEAVLKVSLVTVDSRPPAPPPARAAPPARVRTAPPPARAALPAPPAPAPGSAGVEGAGRPGGDGSPPGAGAPARPRPSGGPDEPPRPPATVPPAEASPPMTTGQGEASKASASGVHTPREAAPPAPASPAQHGPRAPDPPRVHAGAAPPTGPLDGPIPKDVGPEPAGGARFHPAASDGVAAGGSGAAHGPIAGAGRGLGQGDGRGLGPASGPGTGVAGRGPGADGAGAGPGGGTGPRPPSVADLLAAVRRRIEAAKRYPDEARRDGIQGTVTVRFRLRVDGQVEAAEVARSSGSRMLDDASLDTIRRAAPFPPLKGWVQVPLAYTLNEAER